MKVIVFDLGGTLMQYVGMPHSWVDFYDQGFSAIIREYDCNVSKDDVEKSIQILKDFNPLRFQVTGNPIRKGCK